ncbi:DUF2982 domain-containing protein [Catenovulum maritimum]|uniref:DUF2982 domain-containing protein n=1 Tax=Catenovulum maritimum TaxID=1513271 RepID=A0A0J8GRU6_9ALTE|nr:DUF2982 domain-containing protein [Catenovulum maritimum]KMT65452.1 hypothetical protein XM47_08850 [Catenovulum maritimum]
MKENQIFIKASTAANGRSIFVISFICFVALFIIKLAWVEMYQIQIIFLIMASITGMILGYFKSSEPEFSFVLKVDGLYYQNRFGYIFISWDNISLVGVPKSVGLNQTEMAYVGIKLKQPELLLTSISLRLISHLMVEQKAIFEYYLRHSDKKFDDDYGSFILNSYKSEQETYTGLRAMFAHRMKQFREFSGYDIFFPETAMDRSSSEFKVLLNNYRQQGRNKL